jgi:hypothetical protein
MMDRRDALLLVDRLKRRTRDPEVLTLCEYVRGTDVHGRVQGLRIRETPDDLSWEADPLASTSRGPGSRWSTKSRSGTPAPAINSVGCLRLRPQP